MPETGAFRLAPFSGLFLLNDQGRGPVGPLPWISSRGCPTARWDGPRALLRHGSGGTIGSPVVETSSSLKSLRAKVKGTLFVWGATTSARLLSEGLVFVRLCDPWSPLLRATMRSAVRH